MALPEPVAPRVDDEPRVESWGTMRAVLREGRDAGRVELDGLASGGAVGVGALAELAGEVTIVDGAVLVAVVEGGDRRVTAAREGDAAALLVRAEVARWREVSLPDCSSYAELEAAVAERLAALGFDPHRPTPVRIRGEALELELHVLAGACPQANPSGPPPWRFRGPVERVELVGFSVEGAAGRFTHHGRGSHLHAVAPGVMGHLDEVSIREVVLAVPARP